MIELENFKQFVEKLKSTSSRLEKEKILKGEENNSSIKSIMKFIFDPYIITGISKKKFEKKVSIEPSTYLNTIDDLMNYLKVNNHGSDKDIANINHFVEHNFEYKEIIYSIVCKDLTVGVTAVTINKIWGKGFINQFAVMLAEKYFDDPEKNLPQGTEFILTEKLDGVRCVLLFDEKGDPHFFSRNGKEITGLVELENEAKMLDKSLVYDGELLANTKGHSKDVYRDTMSIVGSDAIKINIIYNMFDCMPYVEFVRGYSDTASVIRKATLHRMLYEKDIKWIKEVPVLYIGKDQTKIKEYLDLARSYDKEGIMINVANAGYQCKRTKSLLKVKVFNECEAFVTNVEQGTGRNENRLGNIVVKFKDKTGKYHSVKVGSGFSDEQRLTYWIQPELILNKIVEISYFEVSNNKDNDSLSLRFPTWLDRIRNDKSLETMNCI